MSTSCDVLRSHTYLGGTNWLWWCRGVEAVRCEPRSEGCVVGRGIFTDADDDVALASRKEFGNVLPGETCTIAFAFMHYSTASCDVPSRSIKMDCRECLLQHLLQHLLQPLAGSCGARGTTEHY